MLDTVVINGMSDMNKQYYMIEFRIALTTIYRLVYDGINDRLCFWSHEFSYYNINSSDFYVMKRIIHDPLIVFPVSTIYVYDEVEITEIIPDVILSTLGGYDRLIKEARKAVVEDLL